MFCWWVSDAKKPLLHRFTQLLKKALPSPSATSLRTVVFVLSWARLVTAAGAQQIGSRIQQSLPKWCKHLSSRLSTFWHSRDPLRRLDILVFRPIEAWNCLWLVWIVIAQTLGVWQRCDCVTSSWGGANYMDLTQYSFTASARVTPYWVSGTAISVTFMSLAITYVFVEWCVQSHLSTTDMRKAANGLQHTRRFRVLLSPLRWLIWNLCWWDRKTALKWTKHDGQDAAHFGRSGTFQVLEAGASPTQPTDGGMALNRDNQERTLAVPSFDRTSSSRSPSPSSFGKKSSTSQID